VAFLTYGHGFDELSKFIWLLSIMAKSLCNISVNRIEVLVFSSDSEEEPLK
jgi:hypothetical protein